jgi:hypothetical protein
VPLTSEEATPKSVEKKNWSVEGDLEIFSVSERQEKKNQF